MELNTAVMVSHLGLAHEAYRDVVRGGPAPEELGEALASLFSAEAVGKVLIYGSDKGTGRMLKSLMPDVFLTFINSDTLCREMRLDFDCIVLGAGPNHYRKIIDTLRRRGPLRPYRVVTVFDMSREDSRPAVAESKAIWERRLPEEVAFWRQRISNPEERTRYVRKFSSVRRPFPEYLATVADGFADHGEIRVLDVGAGPVSVLGDEYAKPVAITAVDPLADDYNAILDEYGVTPFTRTISMAGEDIGRHFPPEHFHVTHSRNALDHAYDPAQIIRMMFALTKVNGVLCLWGSCSEGMKQNYQGLHLWNFEVIDGEFLLFDRRYTEIANLSAELSPYADIRLEVRDDDIYWARFFKKVSYTPGN